MSGVFTSKSLNALRVALLGNMNNNHFALARYLRDRGVDCDLLLFAGEFEHFHPKTDTFDLGYCPWVKQLDWGGEGSVSSVKKQVIKSTLEKYDVFIGTGYAPAFMSKAGLQLDIFDPYGGDIWEATQYKIPAPHYLRRHLSAVYFQRKGLSQVKILHSSATNSMYGERFKKLAPNATHWKLGMPMVYAPCYSSSDLTLMLSRTHWGHEFERIRSSCEFMLIAHGRHVWGSPQNPNSKGNDRLLDGWALFCKKHPSISKQLVFLEYGQDVEITKEHIKRLGIEKTVTWLPKMYRKDIMPGLFLADMVAAEFIHSWMAGGVLYEALAASKPILSYRDDVLYREHTPNLYPIYNAKTSDEIAARLDEYITKPDAGKEMGLIGRLWYEENVVNTAVDKYIDYLEVRATELGKSLR